MINVRHMDMEIYSAKAREIAAQVLSRRGPAFARRQGAGGLDAIEADGFRLEAFRRACIREVRKGLLSYIESHELVMRVQPFYDPCRGACRYRRRGIELGDVPRALIDVEKLVPEFPRLLSDAVIEARRRNLVSRIESITEKAKQDCNPEITDNG